MSTSVTSEDNDKVDEIRRQKKQWRKTIRSKLRNLKQEDIDKQSNDIWCQLWDMEEYRNATSVGLFLSMPKGEIHTYDACNRVLKDGKQLYVPRVGLDFEACDMDMIQVVSPSSTSSSSGKLFCHDWPRNKWDIPEPPSFGNEDECKVAQPGDIDLLIVPGLAFDQNGGRLGQGKGYYDRFIAKMRLTKESNKKPLLVAVALDPSYLCADIIPTSVHDYPMDMIITATTIIKA